MRWQQIKSILQAAQIPIGKVVKSQFFAPLQSVEIEGSSNK